MKNGIKDTKIFSTGDFFRIMPDVVHVFHYLENTSIIGLYDKGVETEAGKDIIDFGLSIWLWRRGYIWIWSIIL